MQIHTPVVRSVDVGYGVVKYVVEDSPTGDIRCDSFPSLAPHAPAQDLAVGIAPARRTVQVRVGEVVYEVGKDADLLTGLHGSQRVLHDQYVDTPEYAALLLGALKQMGTPVIDILVLGLPVKFLQKKTDSLKRLATGIHEFPDGTTVVVKQTLVMAQPLGGLIDHFGREQHAATAASAIERTHLLVDPGYYTLDWVVARGLGVRPELSSSVPCGMSALLSAIATAISRHTATPYGNLTAIDDGLRSGIFDVEGAPYDLAQHVDEARRSLRHGLIEMQNAVGTAQDVRGVFLMGGGAGYFEPLIREMFPRHTVLTVDDPCFANVRGFQWAGRMSAISSKRSSLPEAA